MAENSRMSKLSEKGDECIFTWKVFTGWDYMIGNAETAQNRVSSIVLGFKEALLEEAEKKRQSRDWKIIATRILVNIWVTLLLGASAYVVVMVVQRSSETDAQKTWWRRSETTVVMTLIGSVFPMFFELLGFFERYHPRKQLRLQLGRIMVLNLLNLYSLIFAVFDKIDDMTKEQQEIIYKLQNQSKALTYPSISVNYSGCHNVSFSCPEASTTPLALMVSSLVTAALVNTTTVNYTDIMKYFTTPIDTTTELYISDKIITDINNNLTDVTSESTVDFDDVTTFGYKNNTDENYNNFTSSESENFTTENYSKYSFTLNVSEDYSTIDYTSSSIPSDSSDTDSVFEEMYDDEYDITDSELNTTETNITETVDKYLTSVINDILTTTFSYDSETDFDFTDFTINNASKTSLEYFTTLTAYLNDTSTIEFQTEVGQLVEKVISTTMTQLTSEKTTKLCHEELCEHSISTTPEVLTTTSVSATKPAKSAVKRVKPKINFNATSYKIRSKLHTLCWETNFGQELIKLTVMDLVMNVLATLGMDFARAIFVRVMNNCWCWDLEKKFPQYGDFKVAENILHLINNQGLVWMGMFFSPGLTIFNLVKLIIMMYLRSWAVLTCNVPHEIVFRASRSNNFYFALLLIMLFLCVLPVGYAIVWVEPSWYCGPFSQYNKIYYIFTESLKNALPDNFQNALDYIASPGTIIPLLVLLILIIYYLVELTSALREANTDLKTQLRRERTEERRKMFQIAGRKRNGSTGSEIDNTPFSKWKKLLSTLPTNRSLEETGPTKEMAEEKEKEMEKNENKNKDILAKFIRRALRKTSVTSDDADDATDNEQHDSLPDDISQRERKLTPVGSFKNTVSAALQSLKQNAAQSPNEDSQIQPVAEKQKGEETKDNTQDMHQDSVGSVWSDNIPVIKISKTESAECILESQEASPTLSDGSRGRKQKIKHQEEHIEEKVDDDRISDDESRVESIIKK